MGGEGVPSPWTGPISVLRDIGSIAERGQAASHEEAFGGSGSSSDDNNLTLSIRRQQGTALRIAACESYQDAVVTANTEGLLSYLRARLFCAAASRRKATGSQSDAKGGAHPTVQRLESQVLLRIMLPNKMAHGPSCSCDFVRAFLCPGSIAVEENIIFMTWEH